MLKRIAHINLGVIDLEKAEAFYRDILGLRRVRVMDLTEGRRLLLMSPGGECELELYYHPKGPVDRPAGSAALGYRHVAFAVDDIYVAVDTLKAKGIAFTASANPSST